MASNVTQAQFESTFDTLPREAQQQFLHDHLFPLLNSLPTDKQSRLLLNLSDAQKRYRKLPELSISSKKAELEALFDELRRDSHRYANSSARNEISSEIVESITAWLSEIWQAVFEFGVQFEEGHRCLMFASETVKKLVSTGTGCKCSLMSMHVPATIRNSKNKVIKEFACTGVDMLDNAFLWVWRDMLLKMLSTRLPHLENTVTSILSDIQSVTRDPSASLQRLLFSETRSSPLNYGEEDEDDSYTDASSSCSADSEINISNFPSNTNTVTPSHWPPTIASQLPTLRTHVITSLFATFKEQPSFPLYVSLASLSPTCLPAVSSFLDSNLTTSAPAAVTALELYTTFGYSNRVLTVLDTAATVFRPRDATKLQTAVRFLVRSKKVEEALGVAERELQDCIVRMRACIEGAFAGVESNESRMIWNSEVKGKRMGSQTRKDGIEKWVDSVIIDTGHSNPLGNFAAMLFGFPPSTDPTDTEEHDPFMFSSIKDDHPDYEDLKEEWRPQLKERFEGWTGQAEMIKNVGMRLLGEIEGLIKKQMWWMTESDVVDEMISRLQDRPSKFHICDALESISSFLSAQRRRAIATKARAQRRAANSNASKSRKKIFSTPLSPPLANPFASSSHSGPNASGPSASTARVVPPSMPQVMGIFDHEGDDDDDMPSLVPDFDVSGMPGLEGLD